MHTYLPFFQRLAIYVFDLSEMYSGNKKHSHITHRVPVPPLPLQQSDCRSGWLTIQRSIVLALQAFFIDAPQNIHECLPLSVQCCEGRHSHLHDCTYWGLVLALQSAPLPRFSRASTTLCQSTGLCNLLKVSSSCLSDHVDVRIHLSC